MTTAQFVNLSLFILVVINPVSKMALVAGLAESHTKRELRALSRDACLVGFLLLVVFAFAGKFILRDVFHIRLYSVEFAGGVAIFLMGLKAMWEGHFFAPAADLQLRQMSAAPVAMPMIAGPATIAAVIAAAVKQPPLLVSLAVAPGMAVNYLGMLTAGALGARMAGTRFLGPLVRITGLFMAAIGAEMMLSGLASWYSALSGAPGGAAL